MKVNVQAVNFNVDRKLVDFIQERMDKLEKYYDKIVSAEVFLRLENTSDKENKTAEIKIIVPGDDFLVKKTISAAIKFDVKTIIIGGGVSASQYLRDELTKTAAQKLPLVKVVIPSRQYSTDNGAMVATTAILHSRPKSDYKSEMPADSNFQL